MTGFEKYMQESGFVLFEGSSKPFCTFDNCSRAYQDNKGHRFLIGLYAQPTRIGIISPLVEWKGQVFDFTPTEDMYESFYNQILKL